VRYLSFVFACGKACDKIVLLARMVESDTWIGKSSRVTSRMPWQLWQNQKATSAPTELTKASWKHPEGQHALACMHTLCASYQLCLTHHSMMCIYDICRRWVYVEQLKSTQACQVLLSRKTLGVAHLRATFAVTSLTGHQAFKQWLLRLFQQYFLFSLLVSVISGSEWSQYSATSQ